jgi:hypothetical protein
MVHIVTARPQRVNMQVLIACYIYECGRHCDIRLQVPTTIQPTLITRNDLDPVPKTAHPHSVSPYNPSGVSLQSPSSDFQLDVLQDVSWPKFCLHVAASLISPS